MLDMDKQKIIIERLKNTRLTLQEIAREVGCHLTTVKRLNDGDVTVLPDYDGEFPIRKTGKAKELEIVEFFSQNQNLDYVAEEYRMRASSIARTLRKYGWFSHDGVWYKK